MVLFTSCVPYLYSSVAPADVVIEPKTICKTLIDIVCDEFWNLMDLNWTKGVHGRELVLYNATYIASYTVWLWLIIKSALIKPDDFKIYEFYVQDLSNTCEKM